MERKSFDVFLDTTGDLPGVAVGREALEIRRDCREQPLDLSVTGLVFFIQGRG